MRTMPPLDPTAFLGLLVVMLGGARFGAVLARRVGQPAVLGELLASVVITARVLADLGRLHDPEGQVVLGAAVIDDVIGLVILTVVQGLAEGDRVTAGGVARVAGVAVGFLVAAVVVGRWLVPPLLRRAARPRPLAAVALLLALGLAWAAAKAGSAPIVGAFAAGLLIAGTDASPRVRRGMVALGQFFVPLFFVAV